MGHVCGPKKEDARTDLSLLHGGAGTDVRRRAVGFAAARPEDLPIPTHVCGLRRWRSASGLLAGFKWFVEPAGSDAEVAGRRNARIEGVAGG